VGEQAERGILMLFKAYHIYPMMIGLKTQTRRFWKKPHAKVGGSYDATLKMFYEPEDVLGRLYVEQLYRQPLGMMTEKDAWEEGGYDRKNYYDVLAEVNHMKMSPAQFLLDSPFVIKFRFKESDRIDGNGGWDEHRRYYNLWKEHMKKHGMNIWERP
jgi:hypothetical protein